MHSISSDNAVKELQARQPRVYTPCKQSIYLVLQVKINVFIWNHEYSCMLCSAGRIVQAVLLSRMQGDIGVEMQSQGSFSS